MSPSDKDLARTTDAWLDESRARLARVTLSPQAQSVGRVERSADGILKVSGLPETRLNELLRFEGGRIGFAVRLDADAISAIPLDEGNAIEAGARVTGTGELLTIPVGPGLLGRVLDPLGRPLDRDEAVPAEDHQPIEKAAPAITERDLVSEPVQTGILVVDSLFAIGRGQRELIIGDRATGKTSLAVDVIINQKRSDLVCVYVAVGQQASSIERVIDAVRTYGTPERCIFVVASSAAPPGLQWIAPFAGMTVAEYFRDRGGHALVVIDDLTRHAATHRELALLTHEPPGREAYPGDVFYLHARILERAARLSSERGGGSITALPIAETDAGNLAAYIPTNLISITDGQIVLDSALFAANQRPAVDVGLSVSRVGGKAQAPSLRHVSGSVRLAYAQFLELEMFTRFGGISDMRIRSQMDRGRRIRALLAQPRFSPLRLVDQVALLAALAEGVFDGAPVECIPAVRARIAAHLETNAPDAVAGFSGTKGLEESVRGRLVAAVRSLLETVRGSTRTMGAP